MEEPNWAAMNGLIDDEDATKSSPLAWAEINGLPVTITSLDLIDNDLVVEANFAFGTEGASNYQTANFELRIGANMWLSMVRWMNHRFAESRKNTAAMAATVKPGSLGEVLVNVQGTRSDNRN